MVAMRVGAVEPQTAQANTGNSQSQTQSSQSSSGFKLGGEVSKTGPSLSGKYSHGNQSGSETQQGSSSGKSINGVFVSPTVKAANDLTNAVVTTVQNLGIRLVDRTRRPDQGQPQRQ